MPFGCYQETFPYAAKVQLVSQAKTKTEYDSQHPRDQRLLAALLLISKHQIRQINTKQII